MSTDTRTRSEPSGRKTPSSARPSLQTLKSNELLSPDSGYSYHRSKTPRSKTSFSSRVRPHQQIVEDLRQLTISPSPQRSTSVVSQMESSIECSDERKGSLPPNFNIIPTAGSSRQIPDYHFADGDESFLEETDSIDTLSLSTPPLQLLQALLDPE